MGSTATWHWYFFRDPVSCGHGEPAVHVAQDDVDPRRRSGLVDRLDDHARLEVRRRDVGRRLGVVLHQARRPACRPGTCRRRTRCRRARAGTRRRRGRAAALQGRHGHDEGRRRRRPGGSPGPRRHEAQIVRARARGVRGVAPREACPVRPEGEVDLPDHAPEIERRGGPCLRGRGGRSLGGRSLWRAGGGCPAARVAAVAADCERGPRETEQEDRREPVGGGAPPARFRRLKHRTMVSRRRRGPQGRAARLTWRGGDRNAVADEGATPRRPRARRPAPRCARRTRRRA